MKLFKLAIPLLLTPLLAASQQLSQNLVLTLTNALRPSTPSGLRTVEVITAGVCLKPDGTLVDSIFSQAVSEVMRTEIMQRVRLMNVGSVPLQTYWKKYCSDHHITHNTYFIQPSLLRTSHSDNTKISIEELTAKLQNGLLATRSATLIMGATIIWFPLKVQRWDDDETLKD